MLLRKLDARVRQRRAHALARLAHGPVGQPDHGERRQPLTDIHLDRDRHALHSLQGECQHAREQCRG